MRVGATHQLALVLENLNVADSRILQQQASLVGPGTDHVGDVRKTQFRKAEIVARVKTHDLAAAGLSLAAEERTRLAGKRGGLGQQGGEIVVKDETALVGGISCRTRARVART